MASLHSFTSLDLPKHLSIFGTHFKLGENELTLLRLSPNFIKINPPLTLKGSRVPPGLTIEAENSLGKMTEETTRGGDPFSDMKQSFLTFKKEKYLANIEHFENLANVQTPKFTVIACADSRVCPSNILGLQPGDAFTVRNVANLVPPFESGPSETKAALEFSVNALQVENILVIGHSRCGGIRALMSLPDEEENSRSFITSWVIVGKNARLSTKSAVPNHSLDHQCQHCEKIAKAYAEPDIAWLILSSGLEQESVNHSLMNLLTYPWIKEKVAEGKLSLHGGYYDFVNGTFEKWTLDYDNSEYKPDGGGKCSVTNREIWS